MNDMKRKWGAEWDTAILNPDKEFFK